MTTGRINQVSISEKSLSGSAPIVIDKIDFMGYQL